MGHEDDARRPRRAEVPNHVGEWERSTQRRVDERLALDFGSQSFQLVSDPLANDGVSGRSRHARTGVDLMADSRQSPFAVDLEGRTTRRRAKHEGAKNCGGRRQETSGRSQGSVHA
jgi:hypothetical protein